MNRAVASPWTWEDDFTSDTGWSRVGTDVTYDYSTNNRANFVFSRDGSEDIGYHAIDGGNADDTAWVLRFKWVQTSQTVVSGNHNWHGLADNGTTSFTTAQDSIGIFHDTSNLRLTDGDGSALESNPVTIVANSATFTRYVELIRTSSTTSTCEFFPNDTFGTADYSVSNTPVSTIINLSHFKMQKRNLSSSPDQFTGYNTDIQFANGVTVAP